MKLLSSFDRSQFLIPMVCSIWAIAPTKTCLGQKTSSPTTGSSLTHFLRKYLGNSPLGIDTTTRFMTAQVETAVKKEIVVYVSGRSWCGSGGCTLLVLEPHRSSYKIIGRTSTVKLPIRILSSTTNGRQDIGVWVQGGGVRSGYETRLRFDGEQYRSNAAVSPRQESVAKMAGRVLISINQSATHLYD